MDFSKSILKIDPTFETARISKFIREMVAHHFRRKGAVIGLSGGIDSSLVAELCVRALGKERVLGVYLPEKDSNPVSLKFGQKHAHEMGIETVKVDITEQLDALGVYERRSNIVKDIFPDLDEVSRFNVSLPQNLLERDRISYHLITVEDREGNTHKKRISGHDWLKISACQNMKQRMRMVQLYYYAEKNNYIVAGTTNKSEVLQGFFVKFGDGGVDIEPIAHLYKTHVFEMAEHIGVIEEILNRHPSPDTYSLPVTDKEFYFCMDFNLLDLLLYAYERNVPAKKIHEVTGLNDEQINRVFKDFRNKEKATWHQRMMPPTLNGY